jgi:cell wall-associated NlpC family hydrolase
MSVVNEKRHRPLCLGAAVAAVAAVLTIVPAAGAAKPWQGLDRYCDAWNFASDRDCRAAKYQLPPGPTPPVGASPATGPGGPDATGGSGGPPAGDLSWPAPPRGHYARLRAGGRLAVAPRSAPRAVKRMVNAANSLTKKPYIWGGGHSRWFDKGYDCSGAVSFVLRRAGRLSWPMVSGQLAGWGSNGPGRWVSVYAHDGHVFMIIAGLRFDTSPWGDGVSGPRWRSTVRATGGFSLRHPLRL